MCLVVCAHALTHMGTQIRMYLRSWIHVCACIIYIYGEEWSSPACYRCKIRVRCVLMSQWAALRDLSKGPVAVSFLACSRHGNQRISNQSLSRNASACCSECIGTSCTFSESIASIHERNNWRDDLIFNHILLFNSLRNVYDATSRLAGDGRGGTAVDSGCRQQDKPIWKEIFKDSWKVSLRVTSLRCLCMWVLTWNGKSEGSRQHACPERIYVWKWKHIHIHI